MAVFDQSGALLLGRHTHDERWATFGGRVEAGEDARAAARRELAEEVGIRVESVDLLGEFGGSSMYTVDYGDGSSETYVVTMFCAVVDRSMPIQLQLAEISEARWFATDELRAIELASDMTDIVPAALRWFQRHTRH